MAIPKSRFDAQRALAGADKNRTARAKAAVPMQALKTVKSVKNSVTEITLLRAIGARKSCAHHER
jgi:hypothetical protein